MRSLAGDGEALYDRPAVRAQYVERSAGRRERLTLLLDGMECGGCALRAERALAAVPGVDRAEVNFSRRLAIVELSAASPARVRELLAGLRGAGLSAIPFTPGRREQALAAEGRRRLQQIGVAGLLWMQIMMLSLALYAGGWMGMDARFERLFEWFGMTLASAVLLFSGREFFVRAWRTAGAGELGMDIPIALGLGIAYGASALATVTERGPVYYDGVATFVFFLLLARFVEFRARRAAGERVRDLSQSVPVGANRVGAAGVVRVAAIELAAGDRVVVEPGEIVPADGVIVAGETTLDESVLTGESAAVPRAVGSALLAGAINRERSIEMVVERVGDDTFVASVLGLADSAEQDRPRVARLADRAAARFVAAILRVAVAVALYWWFTEPSRWLAVTVSVLIVTCPCALSLATPTALAAALSGLSRRGLYAVHGDVLERLGQIDRFVFDKTGTLTADRVEVTQIEVTGEPEATCLALAAALEAHSAHPLAAAIVREADRRGGPAGRPPASAVQSVPGRGVSATVQGRRYHLGSRAYLTGVGIAAPDRWVGSCEGPVAYLADETAVRAEFRFRESLRPGAEALVEALRGLGISVSLASGDREQWVAALGRALGVDDCHAEQRPQDKMRLVAECQRRGETVAMVGDGVNDAPGLGGADVAIALGSAAPLSQRYADLVAVNDDLTVLAWGVRQCRRLRRVIVQNLAWAVVYNLLAVPAAAAGWVTPWMAAVGMSVSSLAVVVNASRMRNR